jgi:hypothetical protein
MRSKLLVVTVVSAAMLVFMTGAMAQRDRNGRDNQGSQGNQGGHSGGKPHVILNGHEDATLSSRAVTRSGHTMVPATPLFQHIGGTVHQQSGWIPPSSTQPDRDRQRQWYVTQRNGHELRYRPGERLYYYGGRPYYWSVPPYEEGGELYLSIGDLAITLGDMGYSEQPDYYQPGYYPPTYNGGSDYGYGPGFVGLQLLEPTAAAYYSIYRPIVVRGNAPAGAPVRIQVLEEMPFPLRNREVFNQVTRADSYGMFGAQIWIRAVDRYKVNADLLDGSGNLVTRQTHEFFVR